MQRSHSPLCQLRRPGHKWDIARDDKDVTNYKQTSYLSINIPFGKESATLHWLRLYTILMLVMPNWSRTVLKD